MCIRQATHKIPYLRLTLLLVSCFGAPHPSPLPYVYQTSNTQDSIPVTDSSSCQLLWCPPPPPSPPPLPYVYQTSNTQDFIPATDSSSCQLVWPVGLLACWPLSHSLCCCSTPLLAADPRSLWSWSTRCGSGWLGPQSAERQSSGSVRGD